MDSWRASQWMKACCVCLFFFFCVSSKKQFLKCAILMLTQICKISKIIDAKVKWFLFTKLLSMGESTVLSISITLTIFAVGDKLWKTCKTWSSGKHLCSELVKHQNSWTSANTVLTVHSHNPFSWPQLAREIQRAQMEETSSLNSGLLHKLPSFHLIFNNLSKMLTLPNVIRSSPTVESFLCVCSALSAHQMFYRLRRGRDRGSSAWEKTKPWPSFLSVITLLSPHFCPFFFYL